ncbi:MAG: DNA-binding response regulator, partial [Acidobacteria bacterium]
MSRLRLLICDDHALFRAGMKAVLREQPALVVVGEAADGDAALAEVERLRPNVVLMDIAMPRLDGFEATRRITQLHKEVKVLILTMYVEEQLVARCLDAGAS